jgi:hypothetical protein
MLPALAALDFDFHTIRGFTGKIEMRPLISNKYS